MLHIVWRPIKGYEGLYEVSNCGEIRSLHSNKVKKQNVCKNGYRYVDLYKNGCGKTLLVHRLVAQAFIDNPFNKRTVNHIDGNKHNNCVSNLEWATYSENAKHAYRLGLKFSTDKQKEATRKMGKRFGGKSRKGKAVAMLKDGEEVKRFESLHEAARYVGAVPSGICAVCKGRRNTIKGYEWKYV